MNDPLSAWGPLSMQLKEIVQGAAVINQQAGRWRWNPQVFREGGGVQALRPIKGRQFGLLQRGKKRSAAGGAIAWILEEKGKEHPDLRFEQAAGGKYLKGKAHILSRKKKKTERKERESRKCARKGTSNITPQPARNNKKR